MKKLISMLLVLCMVLGMSVSVFAESTTYEVATKDELKTAIASAVAGDTVKLTADIDYGTDHLEITSAITLDLGGKTLTTKARNYGLALNNGCTVTNGKLNHAGTVAAIKVWDAKEISALEIDVTGTSASGNTINGIVIQENSAGVDLIKDVTIHSTAGQGVSSGIETYNCGNATEPVIGVMDNVSIDAKKVGMNISAPCGTATNCDIKGGESGIEIWIKGTYSASLDLVNCTVNGGTQDVYAHDEFSTNSDIVNSGTIKLTADEETEFKNNTIVKNFARADDEQVTLPGDDDTVDTTWYDESKSEFILKTAEELAGLAKLVDSGVTFEGKTIKLQNNIDLESKLFEPIGSYRKATPFKGIFDGQGYTISNLSQNTWGLDNGYDYDDLGLGLFGKVEDATIKNLTINGAEISGESAICGAVAACAYGECTFENITVKNTNVADYQYYAGGIVGWASGDHKYINCNVDASTIIAAQWGDFDNSTGGVIGGCSDSANISMKDCNVACRLDVYNDVTSSYQWYAYRRCGMLIGNPGKTITVDETTYADAPQLTCENVTVTYYDWAKYTYCEFAGTSWPYVRVQAGISNSAYSNPRYGHPTDANGNEVVDDNHVHNEGEDHFILCQFDQLYGGGQGVYGTATHDGVTIIYDTDNSGPSTTPSNPVFPPVVEEDTTDDNWYYEEEEDLDTHTSKADMEELIDDLSKKDDTVTVELLSDDDTIGYSALKLAAEEGLSVELDGTDDGYFWRFNVSEEALKDFKGSFKSYVDVDAGLSTSLKKILKDSKNYQIFKTEHEGKVPDTTTLGVKLIKELRSADELYLYYWNSEDKQVEEMDVTMYKEGNYLCMEIPHFSTYIVTSEPIVGAIVVEEGATVTAPIVSVDKANPETGASDFVGVAVALAVVSVAGVAALNKRK